MAAKKNGFQSGMTFGKADGPVRRTRKAAKKASTPDPPKMSRPTKPERISKGASEPVGNILDLLQKAAGLFQSVNSERKLLFTLGYKKGMWQFEIVNSWQMWFEKSLQSEFRSSTPEAAVEAFLSYVAAKGVNPAELTTPD